MSLITVFVLKKTISTHRSHSTAAWYAHVWSVLTRSSHAMADEFKQFYEKAPELAFTTAALKNEVEMSKLDAEKHDKFVRLDSFTNSSHLQNRAAFL